MDLSKRSRLIIGVIIIAIMVCWFYPRAQLPFGYLGTAPNPGNIPGERPTVDCPVDTEFLTESKLSLNGKSVKDTVVILPRNQKVNVQGKLGLGSLPTNTELIVVQIAIVGKSNNSMKMLTEGETILSAGAPSGRKDDHHGEFQKDWLVPDHAGDFDFHLTFYVTVRGVRESHRRFAIVCPVKIE